MMALVANRKLLLVLLCLCSQLAGGSLCCAARGAVRHPISVTETDIFVTRTQAIMRIRLFAEDLLLFQGLEPDDQDVVSAEDLSIGLQLHRNFLLEKVTLRDAAGDLYRGSVTDLRPFEIPAEGIPTTELMLHTATYELTFPFEEPPEFLTIQQDISDENFIFPSEMKLTLHQAGTDVTYTDSLKPGASVTLRFDWSGEQLSEDATDEEWNAWFEKQREATLGITSYSSVYSFIYIEPAEIRHEVLIPLATLKTFLPLQHADPAFVEVEEQDAVRELIRGWLRDVNPTTINGTPIAPEFTRIDFYGLDLKDFARQAEERRVSLANGRVGIILTYRTTEESIREATVSWDKYHASLRKVQSVVFAYPDDLQRFEFSRFNPPEDNVFRWTCPAENLPAPIRVVEADVPPAPMLRIPWLSLGCLGLAVGGIFATRGNKRMVFVFGCLLAGAFTWQAVAVVIDHPWKQPAELTAQESRDVFTQLHQGMYRGLDFGSEQQIFAALQKCVDGDLLESVYLQLREGLQLRDQGGAVARVRSIEYGDTETVPRDPARVDWPGYQIRASWVVAGTVEHWGHIHERRNQFDALFTVEPRDGLWKISSMDVEGQSQLSSRTTLRKF
jgi:hypothetical protein